MILAIIAATSDITVSADIFSALCWYRVSLVFCILGCFDPFHAMPVSNRQSPFAR